MILIPELGIVAWPRNTGKHNHNKKPILLDVLSLSDIGLIP